MNWKSSYTGLRDACKKEFFDHPLELTFIFVAAVGGIGAALAGIQALDANTKSNLTSCRSQLYASENDIQKSEFDSANTKIWTIYSKPKTDNPELYCKQLIQAVTPSPYFYEAKGAVELNEKISAIDTFNPSSKERFEGVEDLRKVSAHLSAILALLHSSYDYWGNGVIVEGELKTWLGYVRDVGPNPVFLATIANWKQQKYMSRNFAEILQREMLRDSANKSIIDYFYPEMDPELHGTEFLEGLPSYGKLGDQNRL